MYEVEKPHSQVEAADRDGMTSDLQISLFNKTFWIIN